MSIIISPNMSLPVPVAGQESGLQYATDVNNCMSIIDQHDHTAGNGVLITPSAININADLPMNANNLVSVKTVRFAPQSAAIAATSPNLGCLYEAGVDLYYNDGNGNQIRITQSGSVAGSSGTITGLPSGTASASYNAGSGTFIFQSATNTSADLDGRSLILRNNTASSNGLTLSAPSGLASNYSVILPTLPGATNLLTIDPSGNIAANTNVDNSTLQISSNTISVKNGGITRPKQAAVGQQISSSCGTFSATAGSTVDVTNLSVSITTSGRPVVIALQPDGSLSGYFLVTTGSVTGQASGNIIVNRGGSAITTQQFQYNAGASDEFSWMPGFMMLDTPAAGTYTYKIQVHLDPQSGGTGPLTVNNLVLVAYEL